MRPDVCLKCGKERKRLREWEKAQEAGRGREVKAGKMPSKKGSQNFVVGSLSPPAAAKNTLFIKAA